MKKLIASIFISFFILSCNSSLFINDDTNVKDYQIRKILLSDLSFPEKWEQVSFWMRKNIEYKSDIVIYGVKNYTQTPSETYRLKTGDCEDISLLFAYWFLKYCNIDVDIVLLYSTQSGHAYVAYDDLLFYDISNFDYFYKITRKASYFLYKY